MNALREVVVGVFMDISTVERLVDQYCQGWSNPDSEIREQLVRGALSPDAIYCDPRADNLTVDQLLSHISKIQSQRPGAVVERSSDIDLHHTFARFDFHVVSGDGSILLKGVDFVDVDSNACRLGRIIGFFEPPQ